MTTVLTTPAETATAPAEEAAPGCGCCVPPPDAVDDKLAVLQARRDAVERRLRGLGEK